MGPVTLLKDPVTPAPADAELIDTKDAGKVARFGARRLALLAVATLVALFVGWLICADLVGHVWYQSRQQSLSGTAANPLSQRPSKVIPTGEEVGVLQDPTAGIGLNVVIAQGDSPSVLRGGPGHRPGTPLPGAQGNSVVYAHRKDWGAPFNNLAKLTVGSALYLQARPGVFKPPNITGDFIYTVTSIATLPAGDTAPLVPSTDFRLTLITGTGSRLSGGKVLVITAVSGTVGKVTGAAPHGSLEPSVGSILYNPAILLLVALVVLGRWMLIFLARRHRVVVVLAVAGPLAIAAAVCLFLGFDLVAFSPLA